MSPSSSPRFTVDISHLKWPVLVAILCLYFSLSFYQVNLPGLHYDEAFEAVPALQLLLGRPVTAFRNSSLELGGRLFPLMTQDYIGALNTYLALPFIYFLGPTPAALRTMSILTGAVTLWLAYALTRQLTGSNQAGLVTALMLAVDPTFVFWNRQGIFVTAVTATIGLAAALCWLRWLQQDTFSWAIAGAFLFGLGLYAKFLFLWLILGVVGTILLLHYLTPAVFPAVNNLFGVAAVPRGARRWTGGLLAAGAFALGCWPLILYNVQTQGTFLNFTQNATISYYGVDNLAFSSNLVERIRQFGVMLNGSHLWYLGKIINNPIPLFVFGFTIVGMLVTIITTRASASLARIPSSEQPGTTYHINQVASHTALFPFIVIGLVILASIGTVSALWITHFAILMPWPPLAIVSGGWFVLSAWSRLATLPPGQVGVSRLVLPAGRIRSGLRLFIWLGLGLFVVTQFFSVIRYHAALSESGGLSSHSDAIYRLSTWLAKRAGPPVVAMDWGLAAPITYLTNDQVAPTEVFGYAWESDVELASYLDSFIAQPATLYLWRSPDEVIFDRSGEFKALYRPLGLEENIEEAFYERSGRPVLGVTRLVEQGTASNPP